MNYFLLDTLGDLEQKGYCFTDKGPKPVMDAYDLKVGVRVADEYPDGIGEVTLKLGEDYLGLELPSFIGNTKSMLIVDRKASAIIQKHDIGEIEVIPFKLINHKGRVHSQDYVFLNPIGTIDCLDMDRTECDLHRDGSILAITRYVLASTKLSGAPGLFRPKEDPEEYFFSEEIVNDLLEQGCTNFVFDELEQNQEQREP